MEALGMIGTLNQAIAAAVHSATSLIFGLYFISFIFVEAQPKYLKLLSPLSHLFVVPTLFDAGQLR